MVCVVRLLLFFSFCALAMAEELPSEMDAFVERRDACNHFRGEETYDVERAAFVEKDLIELCTGKSGAIFLPG